MNEPQYWSDPKKWWVAALVAASYLAAMWFSEVLLPDPLIFFPAAGIALAALYLNGLPFWPIVFGSALVGAVFLGYPTATAIAFSITQTLQAVAGSYWIRDRHVDPLFRRTRDALWVLGILTSVSLLTATVEILLSVVGEGASRVGASATTWGQHYIGTLSALVIVVPLLMRWFSKIRFSRTWKEVGETGAVFALLIGIDTLLFLFNVTIIAGVPTVYLLLAPLFWIALRLRPRFVTLALAITALFAIGSLYLSTSTEELLPEIFTARLVAIEQFLLGIAVIFLIMTTLEENRRLNYNLITAQVSTLENAVARATSESEAKNNFIAVLAHELRNPLAPVLGGIDFLKLKSNRPQEEVVTLNMMGERMQTVRRLLDDLLDISRVTKGKITIKRRPLDIKTVLEHAMVSTLNLFTQRHQSIDLHISKEGLHVMGDSVRLEQVFSNLLSNASKYSPSGTKVTLTAKRDGDHVMITVKDQGVGIDAENLDKIFVPFHQAEGAPQAAKGLGIGLTLARDFIEMHEGNITATSKGKGAGSSFTVRLPLIQTQGTLQLAKTAMPKKPALQVRPHILVVDDIDTAAWGVGKLLELKGCKVTYAYDGKDAIEKMMRLTPTLTLLDIGLPDLDGYEVAKRVKERGYRGRVVALTGYSTEDARKKGEEAGFEDYLVKPIGLADLKRVIPEIA